MKKRRVFATGGDFDEHRNTSRVFAIPPQAVEEAERALERARRERPDWYAWVEARQNGQHRHDLKRTDGSPAACPLFGCLIVGEGTKAEALS